MKVTLTLTVDIEGSWGAVKEDACCVLAQEGCGFGCDGCPWGAPDIHDAKRLADAVPAEHRARLRIDAFDAAFKAFRDRCQKEVTP